MNISLIQVLYHGHTEDIGQKVLLFIKLKTKELTTKEFAKEMKSHFILKMERVDLIGMFIEV